MDDADQLDLWVRRADGMGIPPALALRAASLARDLRQGDRATARSAALALLESDPVLASYALTGCVGNDAFHRGDRRDRRGMDALREGIAATSAFPPSESTASPKPTDCAGGIPRMPPETSPASPLPFLALDRLSDADLRSLLLRVPIAVPDPGEPPDAWGSERRFCLATALAAEQLASLGPAEIAPPVAYACGLLHDIGRWALRAVAPRSVARAAAACPGADDVCDGERRVLGIDHATFAKRLAERWAWPDGLRDVLWLHHAPLEGLPPGLPHRPLVELVALAAAVARTLTHPDETPPRDEPSARAQRCGISEADLQNVLARLPDLLAQREAAVRGNDAAHAFPTAADPPLLLAALTARNDELLHDADALRAAADRDTAHAAAFATLHDLLTRLPANPDAAAALERLAHALPLSGIDPEALYAVLPAPSELLAYRPLGRQDGQWRRMALAPGDDPPNPAPRGWASETLCARLTDPSQLGEWLDPLACEHLPLVHHGRWVGGVLVCGAAVKDVVAPLRSANHGTRPRGAADAPPPLLDAAAAVLALVQRTRSTAELSEQLAAASHALAAARDAAGERRTFATIGDMAAGAAHEINNPLAVISGRAQLMAERAVHERDQRTWKLIADQAQRVSDIITELMAFAAPPEPQRSVVDVRELLASAAAAFRKSPHAKAAAATVDITVVDGTPPADTDPEQMRAVLAELLDNAAHAARDADLTVRLRAEGEENGSRIRFTVADDGCGMDAATLAAAFTPFFSAHPAGRRRGLGLPRVKRLVENHGGRIRLRSSPGRGTTVTFSVPAARGA